MPTITIKKCWELGPSSGGLTAQRNTCNYRSIAIDAKCFLFFSFRSPSIGYVGPYLTAERPFPQRKDSDNSTAIVELYDKITKENELVNAKQVSKSSKKDKNETSRKKKKNKKKKEEEPPKEEGLEEIKLVKVICITHYQFQSVCIWI